MSAQANSQEKERRFICTCEKSYLSYAALFTHIKQKHGGKAPGPIVRPRSQNKRGRPRKIPNSLSESNSLVETKNIDQKKFHQIIKLSTINTLRSAPTPCIEQGGLFSSRSAFTAASGFRKFMPEREEPKISENKNHISRQVKKQMPEKSGKTIDNLEAKKLKIVTDGLTQVLKELSDDVQLSFLLQKIKQIPIREKFKDYDCFDQEKQYISQVNCYAVSVVKGIAQFSQFLNQVCKSNKDNFQISTLILLFIQYIQQQQPDVNILIDKKIYQIANYVNKFLEQHLDQQVQRRGIETMWIFKGNNPIRILLWFFKWLAAKEYSYFKVQMNPQYERKQSQNQDNNGESSGMKEKHDVHQQLDIQSQECQKLNSQDFQECGDSQNVNQQNAKSESEEPVLEQKKEIATLQ